MHIKLTFKKAGLNGAALALALAFGIQATPAQALGSEPDCRQISPVTVTLSPTDPTTYHVAGELCAKGSLQGKTMQLLVHGFTYDHRYWDWPQSPQYSYARTAANAGYATLAIDRIGDGASSHPTDGSTVNLNSGSYVLHQIVQKLRTGSIANTHFSKVVSVGHSLGSATVAYEAGTYHDVNGVILSGYLHDSSPAALPLFTAGLYPAAQDPAFANSGLNDTYVTTKPGVRAPNFFASSDTDPAVITKDEQIKQTGTIGETAPDTFANANAATPSITVPVLLAVGTSDVLFCDPANNLPCTSSGAVLTREASHFGPAAHLQAYVLPGSGHDMNLERNAYQWYDAANSWTNSHVGSH